MALQVLNYDSIGTGTRVLLSSSDSGFVEAGAIVASLDDTAITSNNSIGQSVYVYGTVLGTSGIDWFTGSGGNITVGSGGSVTGVQVAGVDIRADLATLTNSGLIEGSLNGVVAQGDGLRIFNFGTISTDSRGGDNAAIQAYSLNDGIGSEPITINYGRVVSPRIAYYGDFSAKDIYQNFGTTIGAVSQFAGDDTFVNRGSLVGDVRSGLGADRVDNRGGSIDGDVYLEAGDDTYTGAGGTVFGTVYGGDGKDVMTGNANQADVFDGGAGVDSLDFRQFGAVTIALDNSLAAAGSALGDNYIGFENVLGSDSGSDMIVGDAQSNVLNGYGGNDTMNGGAGNDSLLGGLGVDRLTGGGGNDTFMFRNAGEFGDIIFDFSSAASGNNDRLSISSSIGGALATGTLAAGLFQSRADNLAQDSNDRFIFRTTDKTLWFDDDGTGAHAAILVADLQASATMTAADIYIF